MMEVILDKDSGSVYVCLREIDEGREPVYTNQFSKFGVGLVWDGHGNLLGIEFQGDGHDAEVKSVHSSEVKSETANERIMAGPVPLMPHGYQSIWSEEQ
jgi:hypothetical protein